MSRIIGFIIMAQLALTPWAYSAVLIEEGDDSTRFAKTRSALSGMSMRQQRKMGIGIAAAGATGLAGVNFELNFTPRTSFLGGFGVGSGFQTFNMQIKSIIGGDRFMPYVAGGFARWYSSGSDRQFTDTEPGFLAERFLSNEEKHTGNFGENLVYPAFGVQYVQIDGEWAGTSLYAEVLILLDIDDLITAPTGSLGMMYYF